MRQARRMRSISMGVFTARKRTSRSSAGAGDPAASVSASSLNIPPMYTCMPA